MRKKVLLLPILFGIRDSMEDNEPGRTMMYALRRTAFIPSILSFLGGYHLKRILRGKEDYRYEQYFWGREKRSRKSDGDTVSPRA